MSGARPYGDDDVVAITGAAGFIGSHIVDAARRRGCQVRALVEPGLPTTALEGIDAEVVPVDVRDREAVAAALDGATLVVHAAAVYRFWAPDPSVFYDVNVGGTINVIDAAAANGVRVVYTSTVGTIGIRPDHQPAQETDLPRIEQLYGHYKRSKYAGEHEALRRAAQGADVVLVQPTFPVGDRDHGPTPTGQTIVRFLTGGLPMYVDTVLNVVDVDDVAEGHLLAAEKGRSGRSYILGGENLTFHEMLEALSDHTGLKAPKRQAPAWTTLAAARASDFVESKLLHREPHVPLEGARMATSPMIFDDSRARQELGYTSKPAYGALARAADWFQANGKA